MRIIRWSLLLLLALIAATGGTLLIGRAQPDQNPLRALGFDVCEGRACFYGVVSGVTTRAEAVKLLGGSSSTLRIVQSVTHVGDLSVYIRNIDGCGQSSLCDQAPVGFAIYKNGGISELTLGNILRLYDVPCAISLQTSGRGHGFVIFYPDFSLTVADSERLHLWTPVNSFDATPDLNCEQTDTSSWAGFASWRRYENDFSK